MERVFTARRGTAALASVFAEESVSHEEARSGEGVSGEELLRRGREEDVLGGVWSARGHPAPVRERSRPARSTSSRQSHGLNRGALEALKKKREDLEEPARASPPRTTGVESRKVPREATFDVTDPQFDPMAYIVAVHSEAGAAEMRQRRSLLDDKVEQARRVLKAMLAENFDRFMTCWAVMDEMAPSGDGEADTSTIMEEHYADVERRIAAYFEPLRHRRAEAQHWMRFKDIVVTHERWFGYLVELQRALMGGDDRAAADVYAEVLEMWRDAAGSDRAVAELIVELAETLMGTRRQQRRRVNGSDLDERLQRVTQRVLESTEAQEALCAVRLEAARYPQRSSRE
ncbi:hypothetical protein CDCA_CDCA09G2593 [Cyanidium caldarium]|uniref:Exocyst complex component n=1 Tax=Cyanidium caldarium TaxID=2771 RepID=A0AAV9IXP2_CYACA|nr:hypothetical protein CDCA_CDCA09G2593 [Cyanidium caldarium]